MKQELTFNGSFNLILGSMWSGKTTELVRRYNRYIIGGKKCLMIKYKHDDRYDHTMVVTHNGNKINAVPCGLLMDVNNMINNYDVICIDEVQFYQDAYVFIDLWANLGKIVEACGLNGTFNRTQFPIISKLIPLAEDITFIKAICKETGKDAVYSNIKIQTDGKSIEIIGGDELYNPVDRITYFKDKRFFTKDILECILQNCAKLYDKKLSDVDVIQFVTKIHALEKEPTNIILECKSFIAGFNL